MPSDNPIPPSLINEARPVQSTEPAAPSSIRRLVGLLAWMLVLGGILHAEPALQNLLGTGHSICGVWGCGPPTSSLLVWQAFIAAVLIPSAILASISSPLSAGKYGKVVFALITTAAVMFVLINTANWYQSASETAQTYLFRRMLFATVSFTDAPVVPAVAAAAIYWKLGAKPIVD